MSPPAATVVHGVDAATPFEASAVINSTTEDPVAPSSAFLVARMPFLTCVEDPFPAITRTG